MDSPSNKMCKRNCIVCNAEYIGRSKYCSNLCKRIKKESININDVYICLNCSKRFVSTKNKKDFCSVECAEKYKKKNTFYNHLCQQCEKEFVSNNQKQKFCSIDCETESQMHTFTCWHCGLMFKTLYKNQNFCCENCRKEYKRDRAKKYRGKHKTDKKEEKENIKPFLSKGEKDLYNLLASFFVDREIIYRERYEFLTNPETNYPLELDFYIPSLSLAFEYDGEQHYIYNEYIHGNKDNFLKAQERDKFKDEECKRKGISLIRFRDTYDYINKSTLIKKIKAHDRSDIIMDYL